MTPAYLQPRYDEVDLRELFTVLWQGKWLIICSSLLFLLVAIAYTLSQSNVYRAQAVIAPVNNPFQLPIDQQSSLSIDELETELFSQTMADNMAELAKRPINVITKIQRKQGTIQISAEGKEPSELLSRIKAVTETIDSSYKSLIRQRTEQSLNILNNELNRLDSEVVRASLGDYVAKQTYKLAMLNHPSTKLIQVVKPVSEPISPIKPNRKLIASMGFFIGFMLSIATILVRFAFKRKNIE
ncbi:hypothetical protein BZJ19_00020 [Salinivibrio proteolyticus]|nr:hypothetical protein BZJ19_00020 [Salinivibrio proteolyticus]